MTSRFSVGPDTHDTPTATLGGEYIRQRWVLFHLFRATMVRHPQSHCGIGLPTLAVAIAAMVAPASAASEVGGVERAQAPASITALINGWNSEDRCVRVEPFYCGEVFSNTRGGRSTKGATRYLGLLDVPVTIDLERLASPLPGTFFLLGQNTHGQGISEEFVGDAQVLSNIDSFRNIAQVSEYWWEFQLFGDDMTVRLGKQDLNTEFLFMELAADFIQSTFGLSPSTAFPTYPDQSAGAVVLVQLAESWQLKAGVWDAFASGNGWGFSGNDSVLAIAEVERPYALAGDRLPGVVAVGAVYEASGEVDGAPVSAVHEYYLQVEQWIAQERVSGDEPPQGVGVFAGLYPRFPGRFKTADAPGHSFVAGVTSTGLIPSRDSDVLGIGLAWTELFAGGTGEECVWELFYKIHATQRISLQPDLQYIASPSGVERDALVAGMRFQAGW